MTDNIEITVAESTDIDKLKEEEKSSKVIAESPNQVARRDARDGDVEEGDKPNWIAGLVLIAIGVVFLIANLTDFALNNWWALFILIPAFSALGNAVRVYRRDGRLGQEGRGSLLGGMVMTFVAAAFLFSWNWGNIWPFFLIVGGVGLLLNAFLD